MNLIEQAVAGYKKAFVLKGRASRSEFWVFYLSNALLMVVFGAVSYYLSATSTGPLTAPLTATALGLIFEITVTCAAVRRLHDLNLSGFWALAGYSRWTLLPLLIVCCLRGTEGPNNFGPETL